MDTEHRIGRHFPRGRAEQHERTRRQAHRAARDRLGGEFAAGLLQFQAGIVGLRPRSALLDRRSRNLRHRLVLPEHPAHGQRLSQVATGGIQIQRKLRIPVLPQKGPQPHGRSGIDLALRRDPAVAAAAAGVRAAFGDVEDHCRRGRVRRLCGLRGSERPGRRGHQANG